jgi:hypothetical protein
MIRKACPQLMLGVYSRSQKSRIRPPDFTKIGQSGCHKPSQFRRLPRRTQAARLNELLTGQMGF